MNQTEIEIGVFNYDDDLIESARVDHAVKLKVYRLPEPTIVLGRSSRPEIELNLDRCSPCEIPMLRRRGGGCAIIIDPGNIIISVVLPSIGIGDIRKHYSTLTSWLIGSLDRLGVKGAYRDGHSDLVIGNRKIAGSCMQIGKGVTYFSASLLVDPRIDLMERYLKHPPREPQYRRGRPHRDFVGSLKDLAGISSSVTFAGDLRTDLTTFIADLPISE